MAMMLSKTYDALRSAGAPENKARAAEEEIAGFENRLTGIGADLRLVKWIAGFNLAFTLSLLWRVFTT